MNYIFLPNKLLNFIYLYKTKDQISNMRLTLKILILILTIICMCSALHIHHQPQKHQAGVNYPFLIRSCLDQTKYLTGDRKKADTPLRFETVEAAQKAGRQLIKIANPNTFDLPVGVDEPPYKLLPDGVVTYREYAIIGTTLAINRLQSTSLQYQIEDCPNVGDLPYKMIKVMQGSFFQSQKSYLFMKENGEAMFFNENNNVAELQKLQPCFVLEKLT